MVESARSAGDPGLNPGLGRSPGEGSGYPLQVPCLGNHMDRGTWQARVHGVTESSTIERLIFHFDFLGGAVVKNLHANAGEPGSIPESGRPPSPSEKGMGISCLGNPMDRTVHGVAKSLTRLSN